MPEFEAISWRELTGNKFIKSLHPAMVSEKGFVKQTSIRKIGDTDKSIFKVSYDREYVIKYLGKVVCKNLQVLELEGILELIKEAWEHAYPNAEKISNSHTN